MGTAERREREKQQRIDDIMDAALEVFAEKGLKNATMDDVAAKCELSKGALYLYFKSKEHLFFAIDMKAGQMLREKFAEAALSEKIGIKKVRAIGHAYYQFCIDHPNYAKAMSYVGGMDPETYKTIMAEMFPAGEKSLKDMALSVLTEAIIDGQKDGSIDPDADPWIISVLLWSTSNGVIEMLKNRAELFKHLNMSIEGLYPAKELLVERGLAPVAKKSKGN